jgi:putative PIN family toxin of toxin-antitoxin system
MTYLQATARPDGPAASCLRLLDSGAISLFVSRDVLDEVQNVLARPNLRRKNPLLTDEAVQELLDRLRRTATFLDPVPRHFTYSRDPKDEPYLNLAIAAGAHYLVSWDHDLLDPMANSQEGLDFRQRVPGLTVVTPPAFLRAVEGAPEEQR